MLQEKLTTQLAGQDRVTATAGDQVRQLRQDLDTVRRQLQENVARRGALDERLNVRPALSPPNPPNPKNQAGTNPRLLPTPNAATAPHPPTPPVFVPTCARLHPNVRPRLSARGPWLQTYQESSTRRDATASSVNEALRLGVVLGPSPLTAEAVARFRARVVERQAELEARVSEIKVRVLRHGGFLGPHAVAHADVAGRGELRAPGRQSEYDRELARVTAEVQRLQGQGATGAGSYKAMEAQMVRGGV